MTVVEYELVFLLLHLICTDTDLCCFSSMLYFIYFLMAMLFSVGNVPFNMAKLSILKVNE